MTAAQITKTHIEALTADLTDKSRNDPDLTQFVTELEKIDTSSPQRDPKPRLEHPTLALLEKTLETASGEPALVAAAIAAARAVDWGQIYDDSGMDAKLAAGMLAGQAAGGYGLFGGGNVATGFFLLAPGVHYAMHTHAAVEIYYCISGQIDIQHGVEGTPFALTPGNYSITPSDRVHSLTTGDEPTLLLYVWTGQMSCPIWLWAQDDNGGWTRERWTRVPGDPWKVSESEPVSDQTMAEAHA